MTDCIIKKRPHNPTSSAGLALVGQYFKRSGINQHIDPKFPVSGKLIPRRRMSAMKRIDAWARNPGVGQYQSACLRKNAGISKSSMPPEDSASTLAAAWVRLVRQTLGISRLP